MRGLECGDDRKINAELFSHSDEITGSCYVVVQFSLNRLKASNT